MEFFVTLILIVGIIWVILKFNRSAQNQPKRYICHDCKNSFPHNPRTLDLASRYKYPRIYCPQCFQDNHPELHIKKKFDQGVPSHAGSNSGCLGFVALITITPIIFFLF